MDWSERKQAITSLSSGEKTLIDILVVARAKMIDDNITQEQLAEKTGLKQEAISRLFNFGANPSTVMLLNVLHALDLDLETVTRSTKNPS